MLLEDRVALVVDRKQFWVNGIALGVAHAEISLQTNTHRQHPSDGPSLLLDRLGHQGYGLMVFSPTWRPHTYSVSSGWPSSKWL